MTNDRNPIPHERPDQPSDLGSPSKDDLLPDNDRVEFDVPGLAWIRDVLRESGRVRSANVRIDRTQAPPEFRDIDTGHFSQGDFVTVHGRYILDVEFDDGVTIAVALDDPARGM